MSRLIPEDDLEIILRADGAAPLVAVDWLPDRPEAAARRRKEGMPSMKLKHALPAAALALAAVVAPVAHAQGGTDPNAAATFRSKLVRVDRSTAVLKVTYRCSHGTTLWISAKQLANGKRSAVLAKEGSSKVAKTWLQSHRNPITCDGTDQTAVFTLDKVEPGSKGRLKAHGRHNAGKAYIQFCVTMPPADPSQEGELVLSKSGWVSVR
jgi:hypothetical protein